MESFDRTQKVEIAWAPPESTEGAGFKQAFVYILMAKEPVGNPQSRAWTEVIQVKRERERERERESERERERERANCSLLDRTTYTVKLYCH